jgi:hypothetical protein
VKVQIAVFPEASVAVHLTVVQCGTVGKQKPEAIIWLGFALLTHWTVTPAQLSLAVTLKLTGTQKLPGLPIAVMSCGQVIVGGVLSVTTTRNEQLGPAVVVQVTVVVPTGKQVPAGGVQLTVPQVPVVVGAG